jgi:hypothetical protein
MVQFLGVAFLERYPGLALPERWLTRRERRIKTDDE